jgi:hypothetical protein
LSSTSDVSGELLALSRPEHIDKESHSPFSMKANISRIPVISLTAPKCETYTPSSTQQNACGNWQRTPCSIGRTPIYSYDRLANPQQRTLRIRHGDGLPLWKALQVWVHGIRRVYRLKRVDPNTQHDDWRQATLEDGRPCEEHRNWRLDWHRVRLP